MTVGCRARSHDLPRNVRQPSTDLYRLLSATDARVFAGIFCCRSLASRRSQCRQHDTRPASRWYITRCRSAKFLQDSKFPSSSQGTMKSVVFLGLIASVLPFAAAQGQAWQQCGGIGWSECLFATSQTGLSDTSTSWRNNMCLW